MKDFSKHIVKGDAPLKVALAKLNEVPFAATLFVLDENEELQGTLTDGDIRRGILKDISTNSPVKAFMQTSFKYLKINKYTVEEVDNYRKKGIQLLPILDEKSRILRIVDLSKKRDLLPMDAVIMAGGKGTRLRPLTLKKPKPLLEVGGKPIIEYNVDRLNSFGIYNLTISIKYLGDQLKDYFKNGAEKGMNIQYVEEDEPLGTMGALGLIERFDNPYILVMNSDLLTNIDYSAMFREMLEKGGDLIVATTPYEVKIPYGVIETDGENIKALKEKPTYTYYSNAGIYMFKREYVEEIPKNEFFNATDLLETLIEKSKKVLHFPILGYWLDIGKPHDFEKAQQDVKHIKF